MNPKFTVVRYVRAGRYFRSRMKYGDGGSATYQGCRMLLVAGDVEVNPGPKCPRTDRDARRPRRPPVSGGGILSLFNQNVRSLKKQLGGPRAYAPTLERNDIISFTETWLNDTVQDSELQFGLPDHIWYRRDRGSLGGGVVCAVRSSLRPVRLPDPPGAEMLLIELQRVGVTLAVCYRPPGDDAALMAGLSYHRRGRF